MATPRAALKVFDGSADLTRRPVPFDGSAKRIAAGYVWDGSTLKLAYPSTSDLSQVTGLGVANSTADPDNSLIVTWVLGSTVEPFDRFEVQSRTTAGAFAEIGESPLARPTVQVTDGSLSENTTYIYRVRRVYDAVGYSTEGVHGQWSVTQQSTTVKTPPSTAAAAWAVGYPKDEPNGSTSVLDRVTAVPASTAYELYWRLNASMAGDPVANGTLVNVVPQTAVEGPNEYELNKSTWTHDDVVYQQIRAKNSGGTGGFSVEAATTIIAAIPGVPQSLDATLLTSACPSISYRYEWLNTNGGGDDRSETMTIQRQSSTGWTTVSAAVGAGSTSYSDLLIGSTDVTGFRIKYNSEATYASRTGGPDFPPNCPV